MTPRDEAVMLHLLKVGTNGVPYQGYTPAIPSLCIPIITEQDGAAGVAMGFHGVTQLPAPIANAAAFDPTLAGDYGSVIGAEDAAKGVDMALAPTINIDRSPLWGRSYESLGEDPYLTASLAVPLVNGIQSHRVVAVVKHYAAYNQETKRGTLQDDSVVSERALREIYLPAWSSVVQLADPGAVMCSYNLVNGTPACENEDLLQNVLRDEWGFSGFVRSDCGSVYDEKAAIAAKVSQVKCTALYNADTLAAAVKTGADHQSRPRRSRPPIVHRAVSVQPDRFPASADPRGGRHLGVALGGRPGRRQRGRRPAQEHRRPAPPQLQQPGLARPDRRPRRHAHAGRLRCCPGAARPIRSPPSPPCEPASATGSTTTAGPTSTRPPSRPATPRSPSSSSPTPRPKAGIGCRSSCPETRIA